MSDKKHIDRLFQEKFKDFEAAPNDAVWESIEARLHPRKKRRVIPVWWKFGGVAAALLIMIAVGISVFKSDAPVKPIIVDTDNFNNNYNSDKIGNTSQNDTISLVKSYSESDENRSNVSDTDHVDSLINPTKKLQNSTFNNRISKTKDNKAFVKSSVVKTTRSKQNKSLLVNELDKENTLANNLNNPKESNKENLTELKSNEEIKDILNTKNSTNSVVKSNNKQTPLTSNIKEDAAPLNSEKNKKDNKGQDIEEAIAEANKTNEKEKELRRWSIAPNVAPVYFNSFGEGSSIDSQFNSNSTSSDISMSYGIKGGYAVNNRLKITAGINRVEFNNTTNDVIALSDDSFASLVSSTGRLENVRLNDNLNHASLMLISRPNLKSSTIPEALKTIKTGNLEQRVGFIEIPLEIEYRLVDKKIGVNVSSGFSTLLLNDNEILADLNGQSTSIGEANNINKTSFSANFGIGVDYNITEKLNINLEPKFKYQLNTFTNTSGEFRPFFIGVYTGLSFKF